MLRGQNALLRAPEERDLEVLTRLRNDVAFQRNLMALPRGSSREQTKEWVQRRRDDPAGLFFVIADPEKDTCAGFVQLTQLEPIHGTAQLGIGVAPERQGRGLGREALALLDQHAARAFHVRKIILSVLKENEGARRLYARAGYREVGVLEAQFFNAGQYLDVTLMEKRLAPR